MWYNLEHNKIIKTSKNTKIYIKTNEILLNNVLDKDLQKMLLPFNIMHTVIFLKLYSIRDNFITSNSFQIKIECFSCLVVMLLFFIYFKVTEVFENFNKRVQLLGKIISCIDLFFYPIAILCLFEHKVCNSNGNIKFIIKLQEIEKITKFSKNNKMYTVGNWSLGIGLFVYIFVNFIYGLCYKFSVYDYVAMYYINMNSMYSTRIMNLIINHMKICTSQLKAKFDSSGNVDLEIKELHMCYMNILDAFTIFKKTLRAAVRHL